MGKPMTVNQELHREYLKSPVWMGKRQQALTAFGTICARCGSYGNDVHHKTYERTGGRELMSDLEVLCRQCHEAHHRVERAAFGRKKGKSKSVNRQAIARFLTYTQKVLLMQRFGLSTQGELYVAIVSPSDENQIIHAAKKMLGVRKTHRSKHKSKGPSNQSRPRYF